MGAMNQAKAEVFTIKAESAVNKDKQEAADADKVMRFVRHLVRSGCNENLAWKSVNHVSQDDIDKCNIGEGKDNWTV